MRRVPKPAPGTFTVQLQALFFQLQFPHAEGVPVARLNLEGARSRTLFSSIGGHSAWSTIAGIDTKNTCVTQLLGLLQFDTTPRYPQKGQGTKYVILLLSVNLTLFLQVRNVWRRG